jgi:hypothetical protein
MGIRGGADIWIGRGEAAHLCPTTIVAHYIEGVFTTELSENPGTDIGAIER